MGKRTKGRTDSNQFSPPPLFAPPGKALRTSLPLSTRFKISQFSPSLPSTTPTPPNIDRNGSTRRIASSAFIWRKLKARERIRKGKLESLESLVRTRPSVEKERGGEGERSARRASRKGTGEEVEAEARVACSQAVEVLAFQRVSGAGRSMASSAKGRSGAVEKLVAFSRSARQMMKATLGVFCRAKENVRGCFQVTGETKRSGVLAHLRQVSTFTQSFHARSSSWPVNPTCGGAKDASRIFLGNSRSRSIVTNAG